MFDGSLFNVTVSAADFTHYWGDLTKEDKMGGTCSRNRRNEKKIRFLSENLKGRHHSEDLGTDGKIFYNGS
jgi:hypothetical protein